MEFISALVKTYYVKNTMNGHSTTFSLDINASLHEFKEMILNITFEKFNLSNFNLVEAGKMKNERELPVVFSEYEGNDCVADIFTNCCFYIIPLDPSQESSFV
jgi:hypothetical protein